MKDALLAILQDEGLYEMFKFVSENEGLPKKEYRERTKGAGRTWAWWISRELAGQHGVVEKGEWSKPSYVLTERGERLKEVVDRLEKIPEVKDSQERGETVAEAARELLKRQLLALD